MKYILALYPIVDLMSGVVVGFALSFEVDKKVVKIGACVVLALTIVRAVLNFLSCFNC